VGVVSKCTHPILTETMRLAAAALIGFLATCIITANAQTNLVLDPSIEDTLYCPNFIDDMGSLKYWYQPNNVSTTDYIHYCNLQDFTIITVHHNNVLPRTGNGYIRILTIRMLYREYLCGRLMKQLENGTCYKVSFWVVLYRHHGYDAMGSDKIGIYFQKDSIKMVSNFFSLNPSVEYTGGVICDSVNYVNITGSFIAQGGERHFMIGNFYPDSNTVYYGCKNPGAPVPLMHAGGFLIDDVSVWPCDAPVYEADAGNNKHICFGDAVTLGQNLPDDEYRFLWSAQSHMLTPKDHWDTLATTAILSVKPTQTTTYYLWVRDFKMDVTYDSVTVYVDPCMTLPVIPNVFTPNGDGINDVFAFKNHEGWELETCIHNRWGKVVFEGKNDHWWDGTIHGQPATEGVYFYTITARNHFGQHETLHGVVTVMR
jgi:gliding motility-associated-like protein